MGYDWRRTMFAFDAFRTPFFRDFLDAMSGPVPFSPARGFLPVNLFEDADAYLVTANLPGFKREDTEVIAEKEQVVIQGHRKLEPAAQDAQTLQRERAEGQFRRTVLLPGPIDPEKVSAEYKDGILRVTLPKAEETRRRKIAVA